MQAGLAVGCAVLAAAVAAQTPTAPIAAQPVKTLDGDAATVALDPATGAILVLGFSRESNPQASDWFRELRQAAPDVPVYNMLVLAAAPRLVRGVIRRSIRGAVPEEDRSSFYVIERDEEFWRTLATVEDDGIAYVLRVDPSGRLCARHAGPVSDAKLAGILAAACSRRDADTNPP